MKTKFIHLLLVLGIANRLDAQASQNFENKTTFELEETLTTEKGEISALSSEVAKLERDLATVNASMSSLQQLKYDEAMIKQSIAEIETLRKTIPEQRGEDRKKALEALQDQATRLVFSQLDEISQILRSDRLLAVADDQGVPSPANALEKE